MIQKKIVQVNLVQSYLLALVKKYKKKSKIFI